MCPAVLSRCCLGGWRTNGRCRWALRMRLRPCWRCPASLPPVPTTRASFPVDRSVIVPDGHEQKNHGNRTTPTQLLCKYSCTCTCTCVGFCVSVTVRHFDSLFPSENKWPERGTWERALGPGAGQGSEVRQLLHPFKVFFVLSFEPNTFLHSRSC